ncbi:MAG: SAM-dependent methyltransferase [Streptosporangiaceae bacterium]
MDTSVPHPARVYDYWLGGKDNFEADRQAGSGRDRDLSAHGPVGRGLPRVPGHAETLLTGSAPGATAYLDADLRDTGRILRAAARTLDFSQPVAVLLFAIMHFIPDEQDPAGIVRTLMDPLPPGSYLAIGHHTADIHPEMEEFARHMSERNPQFRATLRSRAQVTSFFDGLELVPPGVVQISKWRPRSDLEAKAQAALWGGVARKPGP